MPLNRYMNRLLYRKDTVTKGLGMLAFIVVLLEICRMSWLVYGLLDIDVTPLLYSIFCLIPACIFLVSRRFKVNNILLLFCIACAISLIFNNPMLHYLSTLRFSLFVGMMCLISPLIENRPLTIFRNYLWKYSLLFIQVALILSFIGYFVALHFFRFGFLGYIFSHYMLLSIIAGFATVALTAKFLVNRFHQPLCINIFDVITFILAILITVWGGSRAAVLSVIIADIYMLIRFLKTWKGAKWILGSIATLFIVIISIGGDVTYRVIEKFDIGNENNSIIFSRKEMWKSRLNEFAKSPVIGIGFANEIWKSSSDGVQEVTSEEDKEHIEPGSSWLSVLSNTGIIGFAIIVAWNIHLFRQIRRRHRDGDIKAVGYGGILVYFLIEGCFEGWILFAGSFIFFLYWLLSTQIVSSPRLSSIRQIHIPSPQVPSK